MRGIRNLALILLLSLGLLYGLDWLCGRLLLPALLVERSLGHPAYKNEPYDERTLLREAAQSLGLLVRGRRLALPAEYHGSLINVDRIGESTYRRTVNEHQGSGEVQSVLVIGGSTVFCRAVPDAFTLPSLLSKSLNERSPLPFHVLNAGAAAADSHRYLDRLVWEIDHGLRPQDVVVLTGVNDVMQGIYHNRPKGPAPFAALLDDRETGHEKPLPRGVKYLLRRAIPQNLFVAFRLWGATERPRPPPPPHMDEPERRLRIAQRTRDDYLKNIRSMQSLADQHGFVLYVFLQPHALTGRFDHDDDDVRLALEQAGQNLPRLEAAFAVGYPLLRQALRDLAAGGVRAIDLTHAFQGKRGNIFLDFCHVNSVGNRILADQMATAILQPPSQRSSR